ncbi:MAG: ferritin-like domain-containing protein [Dongiaceae bacterium]
MSDTIMKHWTLEDIPWESFDRSRVDPDTLKLVKAASMVESNGGDYAIYLCNVFAGDGAFQAFAHEWAQEEVQHGLALGRWAAMADSSFDYDAALRRFSNGYRIETGRRDSLRGSRCGELVSRCMVEIGTSSYYSALMDATDEPVLKEICRCIAADEFRHYKLFYTHLKRYLAIERIGHVKRFLVAVSRMAESEDDELAYAYYAANHADERYERRRFSAAYFRRALSKYRPHHFDRSIAMAMKAIGLAPRHWFSRLISRSAAWFVSYRIGRLGRAAT